MRVLVVSLTLAIGSSIGVLQQPAPQGTADHSLQRAQALARRVTITRDEFGVPHVTALTDAGAVFGGMYARAEDEMARIEIAHARRIGRNALLDGPRCLAADRFLLMYLAAHKMKFPRGWTSQVHPFGSRLRTFEKPDGKITQGH